MYIAISIYISIYIYCACDNLTHVAQQIKFDSAENTAVGYSSHFLVDTQWLELT